MRVKKMSALALVVAAAGLSLTACGGSDGSSAAADTGASSSASSSAGGQDTGSTGTSGSTDTSGSTEANGDSRSAAPGSAESGSSTGSSSTGSGKGSDLTAKGGTSASGSMCRTDDLAFSAGSAGVKNQVVVNLKNTGSAKCSMHGFPGVQLVGPDGLGDTGPDAARTDSKASTVTIGPGEETRFLLRYIPTTDGSGKTFTRLSVTPPNEKISAIANLDGLTITVPASGGTSPDVFVDPIGYHVGSGK
ncbi:hypothetical protein AMK09_03790 [Streptomyces sp. CB02488]|uniref:DUF4232 domain-containing protein n=1 Tax=Streptomyces sp. CB02488 TaxID=1703920 RepID=UPI00093BB6B4|nr:DUF4232 domain-containing protein [Streptomyces sp. CB02488]OKK25280.1 hypothetical protein AMK09_03790 [Streptomyces sp. CB02488]